MAAKRKATTKRVVKKRVGTSQTKRSMTTKRAPTKRLKKRRAKNTSRGYYPNPTNRKKFVVGMKDGSKVVYVSATLNGAPLTGNTEKKEAKQFVTRQAAFAVARKLRNTFPDNIIFVDVV